MNGIPSIRPPAIASFDHRRRQRRAVATADARTPQQPQIGDEEFHRTCILLEGHRHRGTERGCVADLSIYWITILRILSRYSGYSQGIATNNNKQQQILSFQN
jgi:hypothetical protein